MLRGMDSPIATTVQFEDEPDDFKPQLVAVETTETYGKFEIAGLERGWGVTLGNGIRRVLLGSLPGTAITSARITGAVHEYGSIPYMREGIGEFLINAKGIRIRSRSATSQRILTLIAEGECEVVAGDIMPHAAYEIVNPEHHLATLDSEDAKLEVRFEVEKGDGYRGFDPESSSAIGRLPVDAIFTPVLKANYEVESMSGRMSDKELLTIEVWTDRTVSPNEVLVTAANIFKSQLDIITDAGDDDGEEMIELPSGLGDSEIKDLENELSRRTINALVRHGITTIGQLSQFEPDQLKKEVRNFGEKSFNELQAFMIDNGAWEGEAEEPSEEKPTE